VKFIFLGAHFRNPKDLKFSSIQVRFSYLNEWVGITGIKILKDRDEISIVYKDQGKLRASINNKLTISIVFEPKTTFALIQGKAGIKQNVFIELNSSDLIMFEELQKIIRNIQNFLTLGISKPIYPLNIIGKKGKNRIVTILHELPVWLPKSEETLTAWDMLFVYKDISEQFESMLRNWFKKGDLLESMLNLYFGTIYNPHLYLENQFLNIVQAIESYHRKTQTNYDLLEDQHNRRIIEILNSVPEKYKKWLRGKLEFSNEPSLRRRLKDILESCPVSLRQAIGNENKFIDKTTSTRHYLTHFNPNLKNKAAEGEDLMELVVKLRCIIESCLLRESGLSSTAIDQLISVAIETRQLF
jgi:hypothetical protein